MTTFKPNKKMKTISSHYKLGKSQSELDFVDVTINTDTPLFIDPFAISLRVDDFGQRCHLIIKEFFQRLIDLILEKEVYVALDLLTNLHEPNETRFGFSKARPRGAGISTKQAKQLFNALESSSAVRTGFINSLEECELMIEGISRDKISDLTTNLIRKQLALYTYEQCNLHGIHTRDVSLPPYYSIDQNRWISGYHKLPLIGNRPVLLVPKIFARYDLNYDSHRYYRKFVLEYLKAEALSSGSSLVRTLRSGTKRVYKKDLEKEYPATKQNLFEFSRKHPEVLKKYRDELEQLERQGLKYSLDSVEERMVASALIDALRSIPVGSEEASEYHSLMIGILELLFWPHLINPKKEEEIHQGRKRIDIVMENGAYFGIFSRIREIRQYPCLFIPFECKNYSQDINNPEIDQIAGRFSRQRGKLGFICCRGFSNRNLFTNRCVDTFKDDRGLIVTLDDGIIIRMLSLIKEGKREDIDTLISELVDEVWYS